jgi:predicted tellurium resistance membrane protein TerC
MNFFDILSSLFALILLEIILGVDNLVFLSILTEKLPLSQRRRARRWGLCFAWMTRLLLLASACWLVQLTEPVLTLFQHTFSVRDLFLFVGGGFLLTKATQEIHHEVGRDELLVGQQSASEGRVVSFHFIVFQVAVMDIIFSLDSVLTAVGLTQHFWVMALAITASIFVMIYASEAVSRFIDKYPTIKMLALSFLMLIGMVLIADGFSFHIPRGYVYFAMGFSLGVECLNLVRRHRKNTK